MLVGLFIVEILLHGITKTDMSIYPCQHMSKNNWHDTIMQNLRDLNTAHMCRYGKDNQKINPVDDSPLLDAEGKKYIQQVVGSFLYYARTVDPTILMALSEIATQQNKPTENTKKRVDNLLDYMATHPMAKIRYRASDMVLNIHSDASYLSASKARSRAGRYFFLGSVPKDGNPIKLNGAIHVTATIL